MLIQFLVVRSVNYIYRKGVKQILLIHTQCAKNCFQNEKSQSNFHLFSLFWLNTYIEAQSFAKYCNGRFYSAIYKWGIVLPSRASYENPVYRAANSDYSWRSFFLPLQHHKNIGIPGDPVKTSNIAFSCHLEIGVDFWRLQASPMSRGERMGIKRISKFPGFY